MGIIGGTGSGKSTLVNLVPNFYSATKGQVLIDGVNADEYDRAALLSAVSVVPQKAVLFEGTIRSNLLMATRMPPKRSFFRHLKPLRRRKSSAQSRTALMNPFCAAAAIFPAGKNKGCPLRAPLFTAEEF